MLKARAAACPTRLIRVAMLSCCFRTQIESRKIVIQLNWWDMAEFAAALRLEPYLAACAVYGGSAIARMYAMTALISVVVNVLR
jgi:hypothetical protein